ncbi:MAG: UDP-glucose dehydrogenase family protein [Candidatus Woesearchaeota archaeon]
MKITMVGTGYVGLVSGVCFADLGNDVICLDVDKSKIEELNKGNVPIYEPGLKEILERNIKAKRIKFTLDKEKAYKNSDIIFICVGTPQKKNGDADLSYIFSAAEDIGKYIDSYKIIVDKSTVPVGTADKVKRIIKSINSKLDFDVASNPEFLKEGAAIKDFQNPDRVVIGTDSEKAKEILGQLYKPVARIGKPVIFTDIKSAELIKYASNAMLATRISFMNELSHLCEAINVDVKEVAKGMGLDSRIGTRFLQAGVGYGGSCFPKDVRALSHTIEKLGLTSNILRAVDYVNERQKRSIVPKLKKKIKNLEEKKIVIWGLSFKPRTDDIRESPALIVIEQLENEYAKVKAFDPVAMENAKKVLQKVEFSEDKYSALQNADALLILTEWDEFRNPDFERMKKIMKNPLIIDCRNIYDRKDIEELGFEYVGVGR